MTRYRQDPVTLELVEITTDRAPDRLAGDAALWGDRGYDGMRTQDGADISSRTKHRQYLKETGLVTHDDYKGYFEKKGAERDAYHLGQQGSVKRADIERAIYEVQNRR